MNAFEIDRVLHLHRSAYELLLWINRRAESDPSVLSDHNLDRWRFSVTCETWLRENIGMLPKALRPADEDIPAFANLFSSFLQTSFHLAENAPVRHLGFRDEDQQTAGNRRRLMPGSPTGRKSRKAKTRTADSMRELRLIAFAGLASGQNPPVDGRDLKQLAAKPELNEPLTLWTWFQELSRRASFASQGGAVHELWKAMDKTEREGLNSHRILQARAILLKTLDTCLPGPMP